jgi:UBX domain.
MTEEQQLQAAIRASMNDNAQCNDDSSVEYVMEENDEEEDDASVVDDTQGTFMTEGASSPGKDEKILTFTDEIIALQVGEEPSEKAARIMIRMPDGKRLVRRFKLDDTVKVIYAYVAQSNDDAKSGKEFVMKAGFPPKDLMHIVDESISNSGLAGDSITVRWKDE